MDEMLKILTKGIGTDLWKPIRMSYYDKRRSVDKILKQRKTPDNKRDIIYDLLALTVFHDKAIIPMHGSINFMGNARKYDVNSISMGHYKIDEDHNSISEKCVKQFFAIMSSFDIPISILTFSNSKEFVNASLKAIDEWKNK